MDATQLALAFGARSQAAQKLALRVDEDPIGKDKAFSLMLNQRLSDRAEEQRRLDLEQQNSRRQANSAPPVNTAAFHSPTPSAPAPTSSSSTSASTPSSPAVESAYHARGEKTAQSPQSGNAASAPSGDATASAPRKALTQHDKTETKSDQAANASTKDSDQSGDELHVASVGAVTGATSDGQSTPQLVDSDGSSANDGQNNGENPKDGGSKQSADNTDGNVAATEAVEAAALATIIPLQPAITTSTQPVTATTLDATNTLANPSKSASDTGVDSAAIAPVNASGTTGAPATPNNQTAPAAKDVVGLVSALPIPEPGGSTSAADLPQSSVAGNAALPQASSNLAASAQKSTSIDPETDFAALIAKKADPAPAENGNLRVTVSKSPQDNAPQMPRPLVRVDDGHTIPAAVQSAPGLTQTEMSAAASRSPSDTVDAVDALGVQTYASDGLHSFGALPSLLPGAGLAAGRPTDMLTALRQQLATASLQDQVAIHMQRAARDSVDKISIQLSPTELGRIHVKMNVDDDKQVSATITVERPATLELLQRDTKALERALQEAGLKTDSGSLSFSLQRGNQGDSSDTPSWGQDGRQVRASRQEKSASVPEVSSPTRGNEVDTANGLVNVAV